MSSNDADGGSAFAFARATRGMTVAASIARASASAEARPRAGRVARLARAGAVARARSMRSTWTARARARTRASASEGAEGRRMKASELKRALVEAGVDVSDCFERADLEVKYAALNARGARAEATASDRAETASGAAETASGAKTVDASPFQNARRFFDEFLASVKANLSVDAVWAGVRERANRVNAKYGTGDKAKSFLDDARRAVKDADSRIGATKWMKTNVPKAMDQYAKVRSTPVGKFANFMFWIWLFTSGIFWKLFYFGLVATFLVNMLMPSLITDTVENMQKRAQERMGGMGGAGFDPRMGGMGGAGFDPRMGGMGYDPRMGGMGGARGPSAGGRKTYGGGSVGDTIDVDARVSDRD